MLCKLSQPKLNNKIHKMPKASCSTVLYSILTSADTQSLPGKNLLVTSNFLSAGDSSFTGSFSELYLSAFYFGKLSSFFHQKAFLSLNTSYTLFHGEGVKDYVSFSLFCSITSADIVSQSHSHMLLEVYLLDMSERATSK